MSRAGAGVWLTVLSGLSFATSGPLVKSVLAEGWSPGAALAVRLTGAAALLLTLAVCVDPRGLLGIRQHLRTVGAFGVVAVVGVQATFFLSLQYLQVGVTLMLQALAPIVVIGWSWAVRGDKPSRSVLFGTALALAGAALVIDVFAAGGVSLPGVGWALLSMLCNAAFFLLSERTSDSLSQVTLLGSGLTIAAATAWVLVITGVLPGVVGSGTARLADHDIPVPLALTLLVLSTVTAYLAGVAGAARIGSTLMSLVLLCEVLFAVVLSWLLVGESVRPVQMAGGVLVIGGIVFARRGADAPAPAPARAPALT
ncbi:DMT family transporter [Nocardia sp. NPDC052566]|uniref:DMT family transporter n=1 Tax=Nocardia sp. NPDC052566 TaxID=3364330 RepID=UPI0037C50ADA